MALATPSNRGENGHLAMDESTRARGGVPDSRIGDPSHRGRSLEMSVLRCVHPQAGQAAGFGLSRTDSWDALNRVSSITFDYGDFTKTVSYTYDQVGNRKTMTYPEGKAVT